MAFKTFVDGVALPAADLNTYLMKQSMIVCTSGTRPSSPVQGETIYQTDTDSFRYYNGTAWDYFPGAIVSSSTGANTVTSSGATEVAASSATAGLGLASLSLSSTRSYRVEIVGRVSQSALAQAAVVRVRVSTGTVTTGSTAIWAWQVVAAATGGPGAFDLAFSAPWTPASTGTWNMAVTIAGQASTNASFGPGNSNPIFTLYGA